MVRHTLRSSVVFVSVGDETRVFRSLDEVPADWKRRFQSSDPGLRPQTILIADREGRKELLAESQARQAGADSKSSKAKNKATRFPMHTGQVQWTLRQTMTEVGVALGVAVGILWAFLR